MCIYIYSHIYIYISVLLGLTQRTLCVQAWEPPIHMYICTDMCVDIWMDKYPDKQIDVDTYIITSIILKYV